MNISLGFANVVKKRFADITTAINEGFQAQDAAAKTPLDRDQAVAAATSIKIPETTSGTLMDAVGRKIEVDEDSAGTITKLLAEAANGFRPIITFFTRLGNMAMGAKSDGLELVGLKIREEMKRANTLSQALQMVSQAVSMDGAHQTAGQTPTNEMHVIRTSVNKLTNAVGLEQAKIATWHLAPLLNEKLGVDNIIATQLSDGNVKIGTRYFHPLEIDLLNAILEKQGRPGRINVLSHPG